MYMLHESLKIATTIHLIKNNNEVAGVNGVQPNSLKGSFCNGTVHFVKIRRLC